MNEGTKLLYELLELAREANNDGITPDSHILQLPESYRMILNDAPELYKPRMSGIFYNKPPLHDLVIVGYEVRFEGYNVEFKAKVVQS